MNQVYVFTLNNWSIVTGTFAFIAALLVFIKNIYSLRKLQLELKIIQRDCTITKEAPENLVVTATQAEIRKFTKQYPDLDVLYNSDSKEHHGYLKNLDPRVPRGRMELGGGSPHNDFVLFIFFAILVEAYILRSIDNDWYVLFFHILGLFILIFWALKIIFNKLFVQLAVKRIQANPIAKEKYNPYN